VPGCCAVPNGGTWLWFLLLLSIVSGGWRHQGPPQLVLLAPLLPAPVPPTPSPCPCSAGRLTRAQLHDNVHIVVVLVGALELHHMGVAAQVLHHLRGAAGRWVHASLVSRRGTDHDGWVATCKRLPLVLVNIISIWSLVVLSTPSACCSGWCPQL
jgi:hypothetical protein